jgi:hypothetical protein
LVAQFLFLFYFSPIRAIPLRHRGELSAAFIAKKSITAALVKDKFTGEDQFWAGRFFLRANFKFIAFATYNNNFANSFCADF